MCRPLDETRRSVVMASDSQKLSVVEKVDYGLGDTAANIIPQTADEPARPGKRK
jgi:hypothetical protein